MSTQSAAETTPQAYPQRVRRCTVEQRKQKGGQKASPYVVEPGIFLFDDEYQYMAVLGHAIITWNGFKQIPQITYRDLDVVDGLTFNTKDRAIRHGIKALRIIFQKSNLGYFQYKDLSMSFDSDKNITVLLKRLKGILEEIGGFQGEILYPSMLSTRRCIQMRIERIKVFRVE
jgi:hypothetical protein